MSSDSPPIDLTNHFLIAMPGLEDELFGRTVVFLCEHTPRGALGLVINKPSPMTLPELFDKVDLPLRREDLSQQPVFWGGPLQTDRGFVLHEAMGAVESLGVDATPPAVAEAVRAALRQASVGVSRADAAADGADAAPSAYAATLSVPGGLAMTTSRDVLEALSSGAGPRKVLVTLGYASWGEGQLESELGENAWLTVAAEPGLIFETPVEDRYEQAMGLLGLQSWMLAPGAGRA